MKLHRSLLALVAVVALPFAAQAQTDDAEARVPAGTSIGIGAGWSFPEDILTPDVTGVRFRFGDDLTLEAQLRLSGTSDTSRPDETLPESSDTTFRVFLAGMARFTLASRGPLRFEGLGGLYAGATSRNDKFDGETVFEQDSLTAGLNWGLGITWFLNEHIGFSADAVNPLLSVTSTDTEGAKSTQISGGLIYAPQVSAMFHLWF